MAIVQTIAIGAGAIAMLGAGTFLAPRNVHVERTVSADVAAKEVIRLASSNSLYQTFNPFKDTDPNLKIELFGPESGVGSGFNFESKDGKGSITVAEVTDTHVLYQLDLGPMGTPTQMISAKDGELVWSMDLDMGNNPIGRVMGLFMDRMVGSTFEKGLTNLANVAA